MELSHIDNKGNARMVDISGKDNTVREAIAAGFVKMQFTTLKMVSNGAPKGDVLAAARIAGIMAAKRTSELIPLCHQVPLNLIKVDFTIDTEDCGISIQATAGCNWSTGVEMEALTAVSVAALTIYDMLKAVDRGMIIENIRLVKKTGGQSGTYTANTSKLEHKKNDGK